MQINLSENALCGLGRFGGYTTSTYTTDGIKTIADSIAATASLTKISLAKNNLGEEGTKLICEAVKSNTTIKELDLSGLYGSGSNIGGAAGAKHVADMLNGTASVTSVRALGNSWSSRE
jgi:Ran GTPase-activating protein (RanGAP) involved in mRNA processing and transport